MCHPSSPDPTVCGRLVSLARPADLETLGRYLTSHSWQALQGFAFGCDALKSLILTVACVERRLTVGRHFIWYLYEVRLCNE